MNRYEFIRTGNETTVHAAKIHRENQGEKATTTRSIQSTDNAWQTSEYDISSFADNQSHVHEWGMNGVRCFMLQDSRNSSHMSQTPSHPVPAPRPTRPGPFKSNFLSDSKISGEED